MNCSLIICTYNWPEALSLVLSSVADQSILPNEIIVADDGSSESTAKVIEELSNKISIPIIHSWQEDDGCRIPHSRNRALAKSNYEYIIMIDGDTVLHQDFIKDHIKYAKERNLQEEINNKADYNLNSNSKKCPKCAETIKAKAVICRFCKYNFETERFE